ncbi:NAD(P)/FAD-dependent oxidoreductase [Bacillus sp. AGMB 02131]|uniref:Ferredoxin--NADP reductase n=1 Tax=Peribacillus faecalis TaxID=2772559 RepID=A0A927CWI2_9BACI|nr:NAD(P)/FAD-dependent oxidoreductase [Peribacillus faecalis]MBD3107260.1 NAD(P)/FAD-dependent oxidoreductase [Peribacillus faecalis]
MEEVYDVTIIGGGPSGLYSAFYAGLRDLKTKIIEFQSTLGGKLHVYPEKIIWDIGGLTATPAQKVIENLVEQGLTFNPTVCLDTKIDFITKKDDLFVIETSAGDKHFSKKVVIAVGGGIISPIKLHVEGAEKYEVSNLHYTIRGIQSFKNKKLLISGGGNSAIDWAKDLINIAKHITVIYRGENLSAHEAQIRLLEENGVPILTNTQIKSLVANEEKTKINEVILENVETKETSTIAVDDVLVNHGYDRDHSFAFDGDVTPERDEEYQYFITTNGKGLTTVEGLYAVGDISKHDNKVYLITGAFQDAINAINDIKISLEPTAEKYAKVSSHNEAFDARNREIINKL